MKTTLIQLDDWEEDNLENYYILAINSSLENYELAFTLNKHLGYFFKSLVEPIEFKKKNATSFYNLFYSPANTETTECYLAENLSIKTNQPEAQSNLFAVENLMQTHLLNRYKTFRYFFLAEKDVCKEVKHKLAANTQILHCTEIDFKNLHKTEQNVIKEIFYEKQS